MYNGYEFINYQYKKCIELSIQKVKPFLYFYIKENLPVLPHVTMLAGTNVSLIPDGQHLPFHRAFLLQSDSSIRSPQAWSGRCLCCFSDLTMASALLMSRTSLVLRD